MLLNCSVRTSICFLQIVSVSNRDVSRPRLIRDGSFLENDWREISRIVAAPDFPFNPELIALVSPIEWKNVILYGESKIDPDKLRIRGRSSAFLHESGSYPH